ncbi:MAG: putative ABC transport system permease protein [Candidatus Azotimanducaceae bacterium]|jgi:putative ABC transport system permease protein
MPTASFKDLLRQLFWVLTALLSHYRRHPGQALAMATGLITGVALWAAVQLINDHARASYAQADQLLGAEARYWVRDNTGRGISPETYIALRRAGFEQVYPVIDSAIRTQQGGLISIIATDLLALPMAGSAASGINNPFAATNWLTLIQPDYQTWYPAMLAKQLDIKDGDQLALANGKQLPPALIQAQAQQGQRIFMDIGAAMAVLDRDTFSYLAVGSIENLRQAQLEAALPSHLSLVKNQQALDLSQLTSSLHTHLTAMGLLAFAVGLFIVFNAVRFSLLARQNTLTTLREMGVSVSLLGVGIALESLLWALLGSGLGLVGGHLLAQQLLPTVAMTLQSLYGASVGSSIGISPAQILLALTMSLLGMILALAIPLWQRAGQAVRQQRDNSARWQQDQHAINVLAICGLSLLALGAVSYAWINTVEQGFVVLALALFGGALLLPWLILFIIRVLVDQLPTHRWLFRWALSDAVAQLPHLRIALMALLLTLTANIGVTTLVGSFRTALSDWLQTRLSADVYVQSRALDLAAIEAADWIASYHPRLGADLRWQNRPASIRGLKLDAPDTRQLALAEQTLNGFSDWQRSEGSPMPILANEQVHYLANTPLNSVIQLDTPAGPKDFRIVGFVYDYGNTDLQFYLPKQQLLGLWPEAQMLGVGLWLEQPDNLKDIAALMQSIGASSGEWALQADIKRVSFAIFDRTFAITATLNVLTLVVAGLALLAALLAVHQQRLPEYAHWRSMGTAIPQWLVVIAAPLFMMLGVTLLAAIPMGLMLSWLLIVKLNVIAFGWTMPLLWSWIPVVDLGLLALVIVTLTLLTAALRVRQTLPTAIRELSGSQG